MPDYDVIVVGGGPAGSATALQCSKQGSKVLLIERQAKGRHKACGGLLTPRCTKLLKENLNEEIPEETFAAPKTLGLFVVPPSGRKNGKPVKDYELLNVKRALFDSWLLDQAEKAGAEIWEKTWFQEIKKNKPLEISIRKGGESITLSTSHLVGADGTFSPVRKSLHHEENKAVMVLQEYWDATGDFGNYFYALYRSSVSTFYSYVIPKDGQYITGVGVTAGSKTALADCSSHLQGWLMDEFYFEPHALVKREGGGYPLGPIYLGEGNILLAGDAASFCNANTGEGISLAIESGLNAAEAIHKIKGTSESPLQTYDMLCQGLKDYVQRSLQIAMNSSDELWEKIIKSDLAYL